jgi:hypothetical protein
MQAWRFTDAQKAFTLQWGADGHPVEDLYLDQAMLQDAWRRKLQGLSISASANQAVHPL